MNNRPAITYLYCWNLLNKFVLRIAPVKQEYWCYKYENNIIFLKLKWHYINNKAEKSK